MDDYDKEALDITVDYLNLLGGHKIADGKAQSTNSQAWPATNGAAATPIDA